jgi:hypothetical protein
VSTQQRLTTTIRLSSKLLGAGLATLWQTSERWQNVPVSDTECAVLDRLRLDLKLDDKEARAHLITNPDPVEAAA